MLKQYILRNISLKDAEHYFLSWILLLLFVVEKQTMNILRHRLINSALVEAGRGGKFTIQNLTLLLKSKLFSLSFEGIHKIFTQLSNINCYFQVVEKYRCYFMLQSK